MGGTIGAVVSVGSKLFGGSSGSGGSSSKSGSSGSSNQYSTPSLCGNASVLSDSHNGSSSTASSDSEPVVQGNLGSSFGVLPLQNSSNGALPTTYADGGSTTDQAIDWKKLFCIKCATPNFVCDAPTMLHYNHPSSGGLQSIHHGGFGSGYDDGGKVSSSDSDAVKYVPHSSIFEAVGRAILPSVFKASDQMKSSLNAPAASIKCTPASNTQNSNQKTCTPTQQTDTPPKEFHFKKGGDADKYSKAAPKGHKPEFITGITGYYACGKGTGQSDDIPAMLHQGDFVCDSDMVSALGDGSSKAGKEVLDSFMNRIPHKKDGGEVIPVPAKIADGEYVFPASFVTALGSGDNTKGAEILDGLRKKLREHKRSAPDNKIPPKAKNPIDYINKGSK